MIPRDYQRAAVAAAREKTAAEGNTLLVLATGSGKTAIAGFYIGEEAADDPASRFLVVEAGIHLDRAVPLRRAGEVQDDAVGLDDARETLGVDLAQARGRPPE